MSQFIAFQNQRVEVEGRDQCWIQPRKCSRSVFKKSKIWSVERLPRDWKPWLEVLLSIQPCLGEENEYKPFLAAQINYPIYDFSCISKKKQKLQKFCDIKYKCETFSLFDKNFGNFNPIFEIK